MTQHTSNIEHAPSRQFIANFLRARPEGGFEWLALSDAEVESAWVRQGYGPGGWGGYLKRPGSEGAFLDRDGAGSVILSDAGQKTMIGWFAA